MPIAATHSEYATIVAGNTIVILGGLIQGLCLTDYIQAYSTTTDTWKIVGKLPWRNKGCVAGLYDGWLYVGLGQKAVSTSNPSFGEITKETYRCRFHI